MRFTLFSPLLFLAFVSLSSQSLPAAGWPNVERRHVRRQESALGSLPAPARNSTRHSSPCQDVADSYANQTSLVPATTAYDCLTSVPFNATLGVSFIQEFKKYIQFQSNLAFLADPPETSWMRDQPVDILGGLDEILVTAQTDGYANHYEFEAALRILIRRPHDGHLIWQSNCLEGIVGFMNPFEMIALADSPDDVTPKIYEYEDVLVQLRSNSTTSLPYNVSAVSHIDGIPVHQYLSDWADENDRFYSDPDARWNSLFVRRAGGGFAFGMFNVISNLYLGDGFTVSFENGTERDIQWKAYVTGNLTGITNGEDLYKYCLTPPVAATPTSNSNSSTAPTESSTPKSTPQFVEGYPNPPLYIAEDGSVSVYNMGDTGIIAIHTFLDLTNTGRIFQNFVTKAISGLKRMGITRVIVDITGNDGGSPALGYEMFKQLFPQADPFAATNYRAHPALKVLLETISDQFTNGSVSQDDREFYKTLVYSYYYQDDIDGKPYQNWQDLYGPLENHGDTFTNFTRWNLRDPRAFAFGNFTITNGDMKRNSTLQAPWAAEDILILSNGACSSTCASFVEEMGGVGVRTFAYGGRPQAGPMQVVGGSRGGLVGFFSTMRVYSQYFGIEAHPEKAAEWSKFLPGPLNIPPFPDETTGRVNLKNSFRRGDLDTPLDFIYEAADFRVQFTWEHLKDIRNLWEDAIVRAWPDVKGQHEGTLEYY